MSTPPSSDTDASRRRANRALAGGVGAAVLVVGILVWSAGRNIAPSDGAPSQRPGWPPHQTLSSEPPIRVSVPRGTTSASGGGIKVDIAHVDAKPQSDMVSSIGATMEVTSTDYPSTFSPQVQWFCNFPSTIMEIGSFDRTSLSEATGIDPINVFEVQVEVGQQATYGSYVFVGTPLLGCNPVAAMDLGSYHRLLDTTGVVRSNDGKAWLVLPIDINRTLATQKLPRGIASAVKMCAAIDAATQTVPALQGYTPNDQFSCGWKDAAGNEIRLEVNTSFYPPDDSWVPAPDLAPTTYVLRSDTPSPVFVDLHDGWIVAVAIDEQGSVGTALEVGTQVMSLALAA